MAIVKGNGLGDILNGVGIENDILYGLGGNDVISGGAGNDILYGEAPFYQGKYYLFSIAGTWVAAQADAVSVGGNLVTVNNATENQWLTANFAGQGDLWLGLTDQSIEGSFAWINGETTTATYRNWPTGQPANATGLEDYASLAIASGLWSALPNTVTQRGVIEIAAVLTGNDSLDGGSGNDTLVGGVGNDTLNGGTETDTADYSSLTQAITLLPTGVVNKGTAGTDQLISIERIIGATGQANVIDSSTATNFGAAATVNINLATQSVVITTGIATPPSVSLSVVNFVNAIGTTNNDTITGDNANNTLSGSGGNDILNGGGGNDQIFGDINATSPSFNYNGKSYLLSSAGSWTQAQAQAVSFGGNLVTVNDAAENQFLVNTFGTGRFWIGLTDAAVEGQFRWVNGEAVTYTNWATGEPNNSGDEDFVELNNGLWNDLANSASLRGIIEIQSNDTIIGSTGNDTINGGVGIDTANYSAIGQAITLLPTGVVNKGTAGTDQLISIETIIGATGQANVIDASTATNFGAAATVNINLATQSVVITTGIATPPSISLNVVNFVNATGTTNNDTITGDAANNTLRGERGNDVLNGGGGNDQIFGDINSTSPSFNYNGKTYLLSTFGTWTQAQAQAVSFGGNLVTVNDAAENQFLVDTFGGIELLWIGFTDEVVEGQFRWVNGEAITYTNWFPGQPDDALGTRPQDYAYINYLNPGKWDDEGGNNAIIRGIIEIQSNQIQSNDTIIGSTGNDTINGGLGTDTVDYSSIGQAITLQPLGVITKGTAGTDQLIGIETIIGATGQANTIDASTTPATGSINASLASQSLVVNTGVTTPSTISLTVTNFANVIGTVNNDSITGNESNNTLLGGSGLDTLIGNGGNDSLNGGDGDDQIFGDYSISTTTGGNDTIIGSAGDDFINGELGTDTVNYSSLTDAITLLAGGIVNKGIFGTDRIISVETVIGAIGQANTIDASTGVATTTSLNADLAVNRLIINGLPAPVNSLTFNVQNFVNIVGTTQGDTLKGNNLANELVGNAGNDTIQGNSGDDTLDGGDGNDQLLGGEGNDQLYGGLGSDILQGDNGNDLLFGDFGNDTLRGGNGNDILDGGVGNDSLLGGANNDILYGDVGDDILNGEAGDDLLYGDDGNDRVFGGDGNDELNGGIGRDTLYGGNGNDIIIGNEENDSLFGDAGNDFLVGELGNDLLVGGLGNDIFAITFNVGTDTIQDFQDGFDKIFLYGDLFFSDLSIGQSGTNTLIRDTITGNLLLTLQNVNSSLITSFDFV